jgi:hypothetical protein
MSTWWLVLISLSSSDSASGVDVLADQPPGH